MKKQDAIDLFMDLGTLLAQVLDDARVNFGKQTLSEVFGEAKLLEEMQERIANNTCALGVLGADLDKVAVLIDGLSLLKQNIQNDNIPFFCYNIGTMAACAEFVGKEIRGAQTTYHTGARIH